MSDYYIYETKCRRCSHMTEWFLSDKKQVEWKDVLKYMTEKIAIPSVCICKKCEKETVQDVVHYGIK